MGIDDEIRDLATTVAEGAQQIREGLDKLAAAVERLARSQLPDMHPAAAQPRERALFRPPPTEVRKDRMKQVHDTLVGGPPPTVEDLVQPRDAEPPRHVSTNEDVADEFQHSDPDR